MEKVTQIVFWFGLELNVVVAFAMAFDRRLLPQTSAHSVELCPDMLLRTLGRSTRLFPIFGRRKTESLCVRQKACA